MENAKEEVPLLTFWHKSCFFFFCQFSLVFVTYIVWGGEANIAAATLLIWISYQNLQHHAARIETALELGILKKIYSGLKLAIYLCIT